jgi:hypothetical protein
VEHRYDIIEPLVVLDAHTTGDEISVDLYGGGECACGNVRFTFADVEERQRRLALLHRWRDGAIPLTLVLTDSSVTLANSEAVVRRVVADL